MTTIQLRFFASVREQLDCAEQIVVLPPEVTTVGAVRQWLIARGGVWAEALAPERPLRMAYQQVMCDESEPLSLSQSSQEIAFFPPVTGG
ncbi:molybdopterin synthase sulfur carrier subunit [Oxalobacteraceae bacterium GrIS 2.11]